MKKLHILPVILLLTSGCLSPVTDLYPDGPELRPVTAYVVSHGWHVGIVAESEYVRHYLPEHENIPDSKWLKFGWGDGRYYTDSEAGFWLALRAALWPTRSVLHVVGIDVPIERYFPYSTIVEVNISESGAEEMGKFIAERFRLDDDGAPIFVSSGLYGNSYFFEANGRYYLPKTSNTWTARALRQTGYPITPFYSITSGNVIQQARKDGKVIQGIE